MTIAVKTRVSVFALGLIVFSFARASAMSVRGEKAPRGNMGRNICLGLVAFPILAGMNIFFFGQNMIGGSHYEPVTEIATDYSSTGLLDPDGMGVFDVKDASKKEAPSIVIDLGSSGLEYKKRLMKFLDPEFQGVEFLDHVIRFQIKTILFRKNPENSQMVDLYFRVAEIDRDLKLPVPISLYEIQKGISKRVSIVGKDPGSDSTGRIDIDFQFLPEKRNLRVKRIQLSFVVPSVEFRIIRTPAIPIKMKIEGVAAYRSTEKNTLKIVQLPEQGVIVE
jgi:hypothetical protein